jgi:hypothetical protein
MKNQFDELTKSLAQSVTRRQALNKFGVGLAGIVVGGARKRCRADTDCSQNKICTDFNPNGWGVCLTPCNSLADCQAKGSTGSCCWPVFGRTDYSGVCDSCAF